MNIENYRNKLIKILENKDEEVLLLIEPYVLDKLIFNYNKYEIMKVFALPMEALKKIDFSNVSFDKFNLLYSYKELHNLKNVTINPKKVYNTSVFQYMNLSGIHFIDNFDSVPVSFIDFTGSTGALINLENSCNNYFDRKIVGTKFKDTTVVMSNNVELMNVDFTGANIIENVRKK